MTLVGLCGYYWVYLCDKKRDNPIPSSIYKSLISLPNITVSRPSFEGEAQEQHGADIQWFIH